MESRKDGTDEPVQGSNGDARQRSYGHGGGGGMNGDSNMDAHTHHM